MLEVIEAKLEIIKVNQDITLKKFDILTRKVEELVKTNEELNKAVGGIQLKDTFMEVFDSKGAAKYLKISERMLQLLRERKEIRFSQSGMIVRFKKSDLDAWIDKHQVGNG